MVANTSYTSEGVDQEQCQYVNNQNFNYRPNNLRLIIIPDFAITRISLISIQGMLYNHPRDFNNQ